MPRRPSVLPQHSAILPQHPAVPPRQPSILTPSFLSPGSLLRSASRSFHGIDPAGSGEVSRALHGICPVATAEAPVAHRRTAPLLPPKSHVSFAGFAPSKRFARCKKQKSRHYRSRTCLQPSLQGGPARAFGKALECSRTHFRLNPRGGPADLRRKMALGGPAKRPLATLQKQKARASNFGCPRFVFKRCCAYPSTYALL